MPEHKTILNALAAKGESWGKKKPKYNVRVLLWKLFRRTWHYLWMCLSSSLVHSPRDDDKYQLIHSPRNGDKSQPNLHSHVPSCPDKQLLTSLAMSRLPVEVCHCIIHSHFQQSNIYLSDCKLFSFTRQFIKEGAMSIAWFTIPVPGAK